MTADNQGNDLNAVKNVLTSKIIVAPYVAGKTLTASQIAPSVADPITELGDVFGSSSATVGLITSDGAPQDSRDGDDATEFHQPGYTLNADPTLTLAFTAAEDNDLTRLMTIGKPDETGVYHLGLSQYDAVFNTVPAPVFSSAQIAMLRPDCPYIELASSPGGIAPDAAKPAAYIPAPGLPGKTAPKTAAAIHFRAMCDSPYLSRQEVL